MYEAHEGDFQYVIERCISETGDSCWLWRVTHGFEVVASGMSQRSHVHAETEALATIFYRERASVPSTLLGRAVSGLAE